MNLIKKTNNITKPKFQKLDYTTPFDTNKVSGHILDFTNTAQDTLASRHMTPIPLYHQIINLKMILHSPIRTSQNNVSKTKIIDRLYEKLLAYDTPNPPSKLDTEDKEIINNKLKEAFKILH